jgi:dimethylamine monooxygenase subunit A
MMSPLVDVLAQSPERARELHDALASMTPAVVEYRGMTAAMPRLLAELSNS